MSATVSSLAFGAVFGLALAAPPGPMNAVIAEESALRGWLAGFTAGLGAMTADFLFFLLALVGVVGFVGTMPTLRGVMVGAGGLLMLYFAYGAVRDARTASTFTEGGGEPGHRGFVKALLLALTNPYQILFWLTVGVGLLRPGTVDILAHAPYIGTALSGMVVVRTGSPAMIVGFFGGIVLWIVGFPASLVAAGRRIDRFASAVAYVSALVLAGFGVFFLNEALGTFLTL